MNHLAHLWLTEQAGLPPAGAVLGDFVRGRLQGKLPAPLEASIALHRRVDAVTDAHPLVAAARAGFAPGARRYAGIVLDLIHDYCLGRDWARFHAEPLALFVRRAAAAVAAERAGFAAVGMAAPSAAAFERLLLSYATAAGIERAMQRTAGRMRQPSGLLAAAQGWRSHLPQAEANLRPLLDDLAAAARRFAQAASSG